MRSEVGAPAEMISGTSGTPGPATMPCDGRRSGRVAGRRTRPERFRNGERQETATSGQPGESGATGNHGPEETAALEPASALRPAAVDTYGSALVHVHPAQGHRDHRPQHEGVADDPHDVAAHVEVGHIRRSPRPMRGEVGGEHLVALTGEAAR